MIKISINIQKRVFDTLKCATRVYVRACLLFTRFMENGQKKRRATTGAPFYQYSIFQCIIVCKTTSFSRSRRSHISRKKSARDASRSMSFSYVAHNARRSTFAFLAFLAFSIVLIKSFFDTFIFLPSFLFLWRATRLCFPRRACVYCSMISTLIRTCAL